MANILIIEDETALIDAYRVVLEASGHRVASASNGQEGLAVARQFSPDVILLDLLMPVKDGLDFLRTYDLKHDAPNVKVIVLSNLDMQQEVDEAFKLGAARYILKMWATPKTLSNVVKQVLQGQSASPSQATA